MPGADATIAASAVAAIVVLARVIERLVDKKKQAERKVRESGEILATTDLQALVQAITRLERTVERLDIRMESAIESLAQSMGRLERYFERQRVYTPPPVDR